ncbi:MAG: MBL fold metallo-hydrolase, partial [Chloroflexales bacterium]|nr:MBL fold metallo-hydrolase [Chloroflexales bacterium]
MPWQPVLPNVLRWHDSCNVYALLGPNGSLIVNAGTGQWLDALAELPQPPAALLCTHFFRDHSAGA